MTEICHRFRPCLRRRDLGWWIVVINQIGSSFHDLRASRVHQAGDGDREFNVDVANWGMLTGALCFAIGGLRPASHDDAMTCARHG